MIYQILRCKIVLLLVPARRKPVGFDLKSTSMFGTRTCKVMMVTSGSTAVDACDLRPNVSTI